MVLTRAVAASPRSDLAVRAAAGLVMAVLAVGLVVYGDVPFWALVGAASLIALREYGALVGVDGWRRLAALLMLAGALWLAQPHRQAELPVVAAAVAAAAIATALVCGIRLGLGVVYAGAPALALFFIRDQYDGINLTLWTLIVVWATDIGAYFAGRAIGGARLAPRLSPNKTWAGLFGGIAAALAASLLLAAPLHVPLRLASLAGVLAIAAQGGDLFESWLKRRAGVKDSGSLLPGHGGLLDRLDGAFPVLILVAGLLVTGYV